MLATVSPPTDEIQVEQILDGRVKRRRIGTESDQASNSNHRRKTACQTCRARKVKCDNSRPMCALCRSSGSECEYLDVEAKLTLESATRLILRRMDLIQRSVENVHPIDFGQGPPPTDSSTFDPPSTTTADTATAVERSRDYLQIPPHKTNSDTVLTWPIFANKYPANHLIKELFTPDPLLAASYESPTMRDSAEETYVVAGGLRPPEEERIPALIDNFLQNVHTKNPILDVETLVQKGRTCAEQGLGWDSWSCLVLVACALGCIAKPFEIASPDMDAMRPIVPSESVIVASAPSSALVFGKELQLGESCFILACRRLGLLRHTLLGAQCHFFAGVYLMYTLRPLLSWSHFHQASILYQLHLKSTQGALDNGGDVIQVPVQYLEGAGRKQRRLEQSLYWSCFKSESEFRVELPLPQSEIAQYDYPNLFPSPPSPPSSNMSDDNSSPKSLPSIFHANYDYGINRLTRFDTTSRKAEENAELRQHAKRLCNEEESWYYYLTEVALRRIGNRIINTFFRQDHKSWLVIQPLISIALEFDAQVSSWSAHLPPAMQHYETNSSIRAPRSNPLLHERNSFVSRELSWATENRLLEMRSWLYQPFLYYLIHSSSFGMLNAPSDHVVLNTHSTQYQRISQPQPLSPEETSALHNMITAGIDCNLKILDVRSLRHRHHGLWYDLRSTMCASLILLAIIKSGHADLIPGGTETLFGSHLLYTRTGSDTDNAGLRPDRSQEVGGKLRQVLDSFEFWAQESPDLYRHKEVLERLAIEVKQSIKIS